MKAVGSALWVLATVGGLCFELKADTVTLQAIDQGFYTDIGSHWSDNKNYVAGGQLTSTESGLVYRMRDFFIFSLIGFQGDITSASLRIWMPQNGYDSDDLNETYKLAPVAYNSSVVAADHTIYLDNLAPGIFSDLASGAVLGTTTLSPLLEGTMVEIALNADGVDYLNFKRGSRLAIGGHITTVSGDTSRAELAFTFTNEDSPVRLVLGFNPPQVVIPREVSEIPWSGDDTETPEPSSWLLMGAGCVVLAVRMRRR